MEWCELSLGRFRSNSPVLLVASQSFRQMKLLGAAILFSYLVLFASTPTQVSAEVMTVQQLRDLIDKGMSGEALATSYFQGVVEGMFAMDSLRKKERGAKYDFCKIYGNNKPIRHPAYETKRLVKLWESRGYSMSTLAPDMILMYLTRQYGC
jgi:hypothetical protein